jgi:hypothetical protein
MARDRLLEAVELGAWLAPLVGPKATPTETSNV